MKHLKEIYDYRQMIFSLVRKELRGRYKGSALGFLWTFINPLLQLCVYTFVFSIVMPNNIDKFYLYLFVGLIPWLFFSGSLTGGAACILNQKDMVKKIYFPREVMPISYVTSNFVNMLLCFIVIFAVVIVSGVPWRGDADFGSDGIFQGSGIYSGYYNDGMDVFYTGGIFIGYGAGETPAVHEPEPDDTGNHRIQGRSLWRAGTENRNIGEWSDSGNRSSYCRLRSISEITEGLCGGVIDETGKCD